MRCTLCRYMWPGHKLDVLCVVIAGVSMRSRLCRYMWGINEMQAV